MKPVEMLTFGDKKIKLSNPDKLLWPEAGITKKEYLMTMVALSPWLLPHAGDRELTAIRYPHGIHGDSFFQKNTPAYAPKWITRHATNDIEYTVLDSASTLAWCISQATLEFHTAFNTISKEDYPSSIVFDLDPSKGQVFEDVIEVALLVKETLDALAIKSLIKTSGASGLQIYIPCGSQFNYETARELNHFFGTYFSQKYPKKITIERLVEKRGAKLYFDYLQMWQGKTITMVYSPRAKETANISMPVEWEEVRKGIRPEDFTLRNALERLQKKGDLFKPLLENHPQESLNTLLEHVKAPT